MTTFALIPAAGKSVRMGRPKLSLPLGDRTVLGHVLAALRRANIDRILVVIGPHVPELAPIAAAADADTLLLPEETPDMRATVAAGLRHIEDRFHPQAGDALLLVPGDHPTLNAGVVLLLLEARAGNPDKSIFIPTHQGKRGHPALIDWKHAQGLRSVPEGAGLNAYLRQQEAETLLVPTESAEVLIDLDNPEEYDRLLASRFPPSALREIGGVLFGYACVLIGAWTGAALAIQAMLGISGLWELTLALLMSSGLGVFIGAGFARVVVLLARHWRSALVSD